MVLINRHRFDSGFEKRLWLIAVRYAESLETDLSVFNDKTRGHLAIYLLKTMNCVGNDRIAEMAGDKERTSVNYAVKTIKNYMAVYPKFRIAVESVTQMFHDYVRKLFNGTKLISLNDYQAVNFGNGRVLIFSGFSDEELDVFMCEQDKAEIQKQNGTGIVLKL